MYSSALISLVMRGSSLLHIFNIHLFSYHSSLALGETYITSYHIHRLSLKLSWSYTWFDLILIYLSWAWGVGVRCFFLLASLLLSRASTSFRYASVYISWGLTHIWPNYLPIGTPQSKPSYAALSPNSELMICLNISLKSFNKRNLTLHTLTSKACT